MLPLLVLAGGLGTRIRTVVADVPKSLAPVAGRPFLDYQLANWAGQGVRQFVFLLGYQADLIEAFLHQAFSQGSLADCEYDCVVEPELLGTGGAIANGVNRTGTTGQFLIANADTWLGSGLNEIRGAGCAIGMMRVPDAGRYGGLVVREGLVIAFREKQSNGDAAFINAGIACLESDLFDAWDVKPFSLERQIFPGLAAAGRLRGVALECDFVDIGVPDDYFRYCRWVEQGMKGALPSRNS